MGRHQKVVRITGELFVNTCLKAVAARSLVGDLPKDLTVRGAKFDAFSNTLEFLVESKKFPELAEGEIPDGWHELGGEH